MAWAPVPTPTGPAQQPYRVGANEVGCHGQGGDEDGGAAHAQQHSHRVHSHAQPICQRHPGREGQDEQEAREVGHLQRRGVRPASLGGSRAQCLPSGLRPLPPPTPESERVKLDRP